MSLKFTGRKAGMTQLFDENGNATPCTVIRIEPNLVSQVKTAEVDGYSALQLAGEQVAASKKRNVTKPRLGHFAKAKIEPHKVLKESRVENTDKYSVGQSLSVEYFADTTFVDVTGISKGKGFQGVMKKYSFRGGPAAHGSGFHRQMGSTGQRSTPGRVFPKKKMPGQMGSEQKTVENLKILKVDTTNNTLIVKGCVPGARNGIVFVRKAMKRGQ